MQSNSGISKSEQADGVCPATPTPTPSSPSKTYQTSPNKGSNKATSKHDMELKALTDLVENLSKKLKKRDKKMRQMQEKADKLNEVKVRLESTNKSIADAATEKQTLSRHLLNVEANIKTQYVEESDRSKRIDEVEIHQVGQETTTDLENQGGTTTSRTAAHTQEHIHTLNQHAKELEAASVIQAVTGLQTGSTTKLFVSEADSESQDADSLSERMSTEKHIDEEDFRQLKIQCTFAVYKAQEKEVALAESRAESEELRCQLVALTALLQHQTCGSSSVPESPRIIASPAKSMNLLSRLLKSPKKAPKSVPFECN
jgi:hypothetical protein